MVKLYYGAYRIWRDVRGQDMIEYALISRCHRSDRRRIPSHNPDARCQHDLLEDRLQL